MVERGLMGGREVPRPRCSHPIECGGPRIGPHTRCCGGDAPHLARATRCGGDYSTVVPPVSTMDATRTSRSEGIREISHALSAVEHRMVFPQGVRPCQPQTNDVATIRSLAPHPLTVATLRRNACGAEGEQPCEFPVDCRPQHPQALWTTPRAVVAGTPVVSRSGSRSLSARRSPGRRRPRPDRPAAPARPPDGGTPREVRRSPGAPRRHRAGRPPTTPTAATA